MARQLVYSQRRSLGGFTGAQLRSGSVAEQRPASPRVPQLAGTGRGGVVGHSAAPPCEAKSPEPHLSCVAYCGEATPLQGRSPRLLAAKPVRSRYPPCIAAPPPVGAAWWGFAPTCPAKPRHPRRNQMSVAPPREARIRFARAGRSRAPAKPTLRVGIFSLVFFHSSWFYMVYGCSSQYALAAVAATGSVARLCGGEAYATVAQPGQSEYRLRRDYAGAAYRPAKPVSLALPREAYAGAAWWGVATRGKATGATLALQLRRSLAEPRHATPGCARAQ